MKKAVCLTVVLCLAGAGYGQAAPDAASPPQAQADRLAAESLRHAAISLVLPPPETPGWTKRVVALVKLADKLTPADPQTNLLLADLIQGVKQETEALGVYLSAFPADHRRGLRWLRLNLETF
ncbi:MAG: hypothetical protein KAU28_06930, partial [Phycisphaerae bacterium]|nr:hypothetical protein [Phycisphaerae bacterium]